MKIILGIYEKIGLLKNKSNISEGGIAKLPIQNYRVEESRQNNTTIIMILFGVKKFQQIYLS